MSVDYTVTDVMTLVGQASATASIYLRDAVKEIDAVFGDGFAKNHPELVNAFMQAAATDFHSALMKIAAQDLRDSIDNIAGAAQRIGDCISDASQ